MTGGGGGVCMRLFGRCTFTVDFSTLYKFSRPDLMFVLWNWWKFISAGIWECTAKLHFNNLGLFCLLAIWCLYRLYNVMIFIPFIFGITFNCTVVSLFSYATSYITQRTTWKQEHEGNSPPSFYLLVSQLVFRGKQPLNMEALFSYYS